MKKFNVYLTLVIITILGACLRFYNLGKESTWLDENFTSLYATQSFADILRLYSTDVHPPLFYLLEHTSLYFVGISEWGLRLFPAICGILSIPIIYLIGKEALDETSGLLMAAMLAVSEFAIMYSQEARMYSLLLLFTSAALYFWLRFQKDQTRTNIILFSVFSALACWSHFFALIPFLILVVLLPRKTDIAESTVLTGLLCLPMLPAVIEMVGYQLSVTLTGLKGIVVITDTLWVIGGFSFMGMCVLTCLSIAGMYLLWRDGEHRLAIACAVTIFGSLLFGAVVGGRVHVETRYFIYTLPLLFLSVAVVVKKVGEVER